MKNPLRREQAPSKIELKLAARGMVQPRLGDSAPPKLARSDSPASAKTEVSKRFKPSRGLPQLAVPHLRLPALPLPRAAHVRRPGATAAPIKAHCELDNWTFDPRFTGGRCPICGWVPAGGELLAAPLWLIQVRRVPWDLVGLMVLFLVMVGLTLVVGTATGWRLT